MSDHPGDDVLLDVLEGSAADDVRAHVASCARCARQVDEAREGLALLADADVPEPSPLYWAAMRRQVGRRLASSIVRLARPAFLAPMLAAAAVVAVALWGPSTGPSPTVSPEAPVLPAWSALPPVEEDEALAVLGAVMPALEDAPLAASCRGAACLLGQLSDDESAALADLLREELPAPRPM